jgi:hypothetical protein
LSSSDTAPELSASTRRPSILLIMRNTFKTGMAKPLLANWRNPAK